MKKCPLKKIEAAVGLDVQEQSFMTLVPAFGSDVLEIGKKLMGDGYELEVPVVELLNDIVNSAKIAR